MILSVFIATLLVAGLDAATTEKRADPAPFAAEAEARIETDPKLTKFLLYTKNNAAQADILPHDATELGHFVADKPTVIVIHGWLGNGEEMARKFKTELWQKGDYNVISVDWESLATMDNLFQAGENAISVGAYAGQFVANLIAMSGAKHNNIHVMGFSFGAHAAGHLGRTVRDITGKKLRRVTAMDPAAPYFEANPAHLRLNKEDAEFVDVFHTNSDTLFNGGTSFFDALGHVDFYPNGGRHQPGCTDWGIIGGDLIDLMKGGCSHSRSHEYMVESINAVVPFKAAHCDTYDNFKSGNCGGNEVQNMGFEDHDSITHGTYFLDVNEDAPFARG
jgi:pancreatic triacylglycerol lipase